LRVGNAYFRIREYGIAMDHYLKAIEIFDATDQTDLSLTSRMNIALIHSEIGEYDKALDTYQMILSEDKQINNREIAHHYNSVARLFIVKKEFETARNYLDSALFYA